MVAALIRPPAVTGSRGGGVSAAATSTSTAAPDAPPSLTLAQKAVLYDVLRAGGSTPAAGAAALAAAGIDTATLPPPLRAALAAALDGSAVGGGGDGEHTGLSEHTRSEVLVDWEMKRLGGGDDGAVYSAAPIPTVGIGSGGGIGSASQAWAAAAAPEPAAAPPDAAALLAAALGATDHNEAALECAPLPCWWDDAGDAAITPHEVDDAAAVAALARLTASRVAALLRGDIDGVLADLGGTRP